MKNKSRTNTMDKTRLNDMMKRITESASQMKEVKSVTSRIETDVKELKETTSRLETDVGELRKEMNHGFRRLDKKFGILSDELIDVKTDITFLEENRN